MSHRYIISVMSRDRVGIVADVSSALKNLGGNLEDLSQSVMRGYFTMILLVSFPEERSPEEILQSIHAVKGMSEFQLGLVPYEETHAPVKYDKDSLYILTASGPDRAGLVASLTTYLREKDINILDLTTKFDQGIYIMMFQLHLPEGTDVAKLKRSLQIAMESEGLKVELRNEAIFQKTNEI